MGGHGPAPKEPARRRRTNIELPLEKVGSDGRVRGPRLPADQLWHPRTLAWWDTWRRSAQAATFTRTDWDFLLDTAALHSAMWVEGEWKLAPEIRLRVAKFGATTEDRARLRIEVETPAAARARAKKSAGGASGSVTPINSRRSRLSDS